MPPNLALSLFGITGPTAYFGITDVGQVKEGETVVVSGAAGATGSIAGQIAKIKGCRVVGTAGGKVKCDWLTREAHFDAAIDYRAENVGARLARRFAPRDQRLLRQCGGRGLDVVLARSAAARGSCCAARFHATTRPGRPGRDRPIIASLVRIGRGWKVS